MINQRAEVYDALRDESDDDQQRSRFQTRKINAVEEEDPNVIVETIARPHVHALFFFGTCSY